MMTLKKYLFTHSLLSVLIFILAFSFIPVKFASAACSTQITFEHYPQGSGPPTPYSTNSTVTVRNGDTYNLSYSANECWSPVNRTSYEVAITSEGNRSVVDSGTFSGSTASINKDYAINSVVTGKTYIYSIDVFGLTKNDVISESSFALSFIAGAGGNTPPVTTKGNYTPTDVNVCALGSTTAKICWKTPSNSEIVYVKSTETLDPDKSPPDRKGSTFDNVDNHFLNLTGLSPNTSYKYVVRSSPNPNTTSTKSAEYSFTTKNADGTGGTNTGTTPDTNVGANFNVNLDQEIGRFWNPFSFESVPELLANLLRILFVLIGIAAVVVIIIAGFRMVLANGSEEELTKAKKAITWAIIGLIVSLMSFSIVAIVQRLIQVGS
jgi:hypothetical protein